jgi:hypothetical protein
MPRVSADFERLRWFELPTACVTEDVSTLP